MRGYITETIIAEDLRHALAAYGEIKPGTPLYDLTSVLGEILSKMNNDIVDDLSNKMDSSDMALTKLRSDIELLKQTKEDILSKETTAIADRVADILWERLKKEREEDRSGFIDELRKL